VVDADGVQQRAGERFLAAQDGADRRAAVVEVVDLVDFSDRPGL
jgi:hypothetical protein